MRGPLVTLVDRLVDAVLADIPRGFRLEESSLQAQSTGLPVRALREAVVNALMHRSYRVHQPVQIVRYDNRIEILNGGASLKPEEELGTPGSRIRNPTLANVFHDTNLAETKGTGINRMRRLLAEAHLAPPTFESDRRADTFTTRLLLHHFLGESDLAWLRRFKGCELDDGQKNAHGRSVKAQGRSVKAHGRSVKAQGRSVKAHGRPVKVHGEEALLNANQFADMLETAPQDLQERIQRLGKRERNAQAIPVLIYDLCAWRPMSREVLCRALGRSAHFVRRLMTAMVGKHLDYVIPDMVRHPRQAYKAIPGHRPDPPAS